MKIKLDGEEVEIRFVRTGYLGWCYYHVMRDGVPTRELSVPERMEDLLRRGSFTLSGSRFEQAGVKP